MHTFDDLVASGTIEGHVPLGPLTTYRRGGPARWYLRAATPEQLRIVVPEEIPVLVLGRGSNLVVASTGFDGLVVHLTATTEGLEVHDLEITAPGGCPLPVLARRAAAEEVGGFAWFVGIPGSVGGAVRMNAGCHGSDTADVLAQAAVWHLRRGTEDLRTPADLDLRYRHSNLTEDELVLSARFSGVASTTEEEEATMREVTRWRRETQPGGTFNAGSVFKNPPGDAAGRIIDSLGLKGTAIGGARVSPRHANFIEAADDAAPEDVYALMHHVRDEVERRTGIALQPEIRFVGFAP
jgi:UDP-N-acetylmuramate dehydrogenase